MRIMWDATKAGNIPVTAEMVLGYDNGPISQWSAADWARFPYATKVHISVTPYANISDGLDVESGDATPAHAPGWVKMRRAAGLAYPFVYCNMSTLPAVRAAFAVQNVPEPLYGLARPGLPQLEVVPGATVVFTQYEYAGGYDLSVVADYWPGIDPVPAPTPQPAAHPVDPKIAREEETVKTWLVRRSDGAWFTVPEDLAFKHHVVDPVTLKEVQGNPDYEVPSPMWSDAEINALPDDE